MQILFLSNLNHNGDRKNRLPDFVIAPIAARGDMHQIGPGAAISR